MTRTAPNRRVDNVAASLHHLAVHITRAVEHVHAELDQLGAFPSDTLPEHTSGGDATSTWPPDSVLTAYELRSRREDIRDWIDGLEQYARSGRHLVEATMKLRTGRPDNFDPTEHGARRCSGRIDATCEQWASEQRLADGTSIDTLCIDCFAKACQCCGNEPAAQRRVDGVRAGEACYKRHLRSRIKGATDEAA